jgi:ketosteroid isomerase-like protein
MSDADLVTQAVEAFNSGDRAAVDNLLAPDFELVSPMSDIRGHPYEGYHGAHQWIDDLRDNFADLAMSVDEVVEVRGDRHMALASARVHGRTSGLEYDQPVAWIMDVRDGRISKIWVFFDQDEARRLAPDLD